MTGGDLQQRAMLMILKGHLSELPPEEQKKVEAVAQQIRDLVANNGDAGLAALSLVGLEESSKS